MNIGEWFSELPPWAIATITGGTLLFAGFGLISLLSSPPVVKVIPTKGTTEGNKKLESKSRGQVGGALVGNVTEKPIGPIIEADDADQHFQIGPTEHQRTGGVHFGTGQGPRPDWSSSSWTAGPRPLNYIGTGVIKS